MELIKPLNNNIALAYDDNQNEVIVLGTGIGFNRKKGDIILVNEISKIFKVENNSKLVAILNDIHEDVISVTEEIVNYAAKLLEKQFNASLILLLADHLRFALERAKKNQNTDNPLQWEVPHLYPREYIVGKRGIELVKERLGVALNPHEASFIALHLVNAQFESQNMQHTIQITEIIGNILDIVNYHFHIHLDETTVEYSRFIVHLRYFIVRQQNGTNDKAGLNDELLFTTIKVRYQKSFNCALKIRKYLKDSHNWNVLDDEIIYLVLHIERIVNHSVDC